MTDSVQDSWSRLMSWRSECWQRFGNVLDFPIRSPHEELPGLLAAQKRVLDVGAGAHMPFRGAVLRAAAVYYSLDTDPEGEFDFRSFGEISEDLSFDLVIANQVLEHMSVDEAFAVVRSSYEHLGDGASLLATVPNAAHPVRQRDCTHITPWPANDLYSLMRSAGFELVSMTRYNKFPLTKNPLRRWVVQTVCKEFRVDWCDSIMAIGRKRS
ncbi:MAG: class I SAM-dependent methyltransferase [Desulfomonile tiedjei]|nr:class I SAM-dependent methyltransferase [Desulfomonile tiedjei]